MGPPRIFMGETTLKLREIADYSTVMGILGMTVYRLF